jgi:hypothetical protein
MKPPYILIAALLLPIAHAFAEEHEENGETEKQKNRIGLIFEMAYIPEGSSTDEHGTTDEKKGAFVPTVGLEYTRFIANRWEVGVSAEVELSRYIILDKDLNRENAFLLVAFALYEITPRWFLLFGAGGEFEKHENLFVLRLGTEYEFLLGKGFDITPTLTWDHKVKLNSLALGVSVGKRF